MNDKQALEMMNRCEHAIESLRKQIAYLEPQAQAYDSIRQILGMTSRVNSSSMGMGEDALWVIRKERQKLEAKIKDDEAAKPAILKAS